MLSRANAERSCRRVEPMQSEAVTKKICRQAKPLGRWETASGWIGVQIFYAGRMSAGKMRSYSERRHYEEGTKRETGSDPGGRTA